MLEQSFNVFLWLVLVFGLSFVLANLWSKILFGIKYRFFIAPGIIIHEFSHALACFLSGAKIREINLFSSQGGYVRHSSPKIPIIGKLLISFAPILGGIAALWLFAWFFNLGLAFDRVDFSQSFVQGIGVAFQGIPVFVQAHWLSWQFWLFVYLTISIIICLVPSRQDFKNAFGGLLIVFVLGIIFYYLDFLPYFLGVIFNQRLGQILVLAAMLGLLALAFSLPFYVVGKIFERRR